MKNNCRPKTSFEMIMKNIVIIFVFLAFVMPAISSGQESQDESNENPVQKQVEVLYKQAAECNIARDYDKALEYYSKVIKLDPKNADTYYDIANIYNGQKQYALAILNYRKVNDLVPDFAKAYGRAGWVLLLLGRFEEARELCLKAYEFDRENYAWCVNLGHTYLLLGDSESARKYYKETVRLIETDEEFRTGPIADFELFIDRGWQVENCKLEMEWMKWAYKQFKKAKTQEQKSIGLYNKHKYAEAIVYAKECLEIRKKILGEEHPDVALSMNMLAELYKITAQYDDAIALYKKALEINRTVLGEEHSETEMNDLNLGKLYFKTGHFDKGISLIKDRVDLFEKEIDEYSGNATIRNNPTEKYSEVNQDEEEHLVRSMISLLKKFSTNEHNGNALSIKSISSLFSGTDLYDEFVPLLKNMIEMQKANLGEEHIDVVMWINILASVYAITGHSYEAEPLYKKMLGLNKKVSGEEHPNTVSNMINLANLYRDTGRGTKAESLYKSAFAINKKVLGKEHHDTVVCMNILANLYWDTGQYTKLESLYKSVFETNKKIVSKEHHDTASSANMLSEIEDLHTKLVTLHEIAFKTNKKVLGDEHPDTVSSMHYLAILYLEAGREEEAEHMLKKALAINKKVFGKINSRVELCMRSLAYLYSVQGRNEKAETFFKEALAINKYVYGEYGSSAVSLMTGLARLYAVIGNHRESHKYFSKAVSLDSKIIETVFALLSDKEKLNYMSQNQFNINLFISNSLQHMKDNNDAVSDTLDAWLQWKGAVMESQGRYIDAVFNADNPEVIKKHETLRNIRRKIGSLQISGQGKMSIELYKKRNEELETKKEYLEIELSKLSMDFALEKMVGKADVDNISKLLPEESIYLDYARIDMYNFNERKFEKPRYVVFVLIPEKEPVVKLIDIGKSEEIDKYVNSYMKEINRAKEHGDLPRLPHLRIHAARIYQTVLKPLEVHIKGKKSIYISPDGNLNLIPFEVLMTEGGRYLMEDYNINYITSGRDIMRFKDTALATGEAVIIADPDYDMGLIEKEKEVKELKLTGLELRGGMVSKDAGERRFTRLSDTKEEADEIEKILEKEFKIKTKNYQSKKALEEALFSVKSPKILHLATHGYFLKDEETKKLKETVFTRMGMGKIPDAGIENPMLRSGIALAGVNESLKEGRDYGLVSADKILGMSLKGTELVVLSACETGIGDVRNGEGVFGLKRSFILSGAKTVVMSLWSVPSKETTELMIEFYTLMANGKTKAEALRQAKINMMKKYDNPYFWGAFVMVGNPE